LIEFVFTWIPPSGKDHRRNRYGTHAELFDEGKPDVTRQSIYLRA